MTLTTLKALKSSIAHWRRMANGKPKEGEKPVGSQCALCAKFFHIECGIYCKGCPVSAETGYTHCGGTPYGEAHIYFRWKGIDSTEFRTAAKAELAFLESLLPKRRKTKSP